MGHQFVSVPSSTALTCERCGALVYPPSFGHGLYVPPCEPPAKNVGVNGSPAEAVEQGVR